MTAITASAVPAPTAALVYRRRRIVAAVLVAVLAYGAMLLVGAVVGELAPRQAVAADPTPPAVYLVQPGDTLWSVASTLDTDGDVRDTVDRLVELNGSAALEVGARLVLPDTDRSP